MLRTETSPVPIQFHYSDTTQWVDQTGKVVTRESIRPGVPVNISYTKSGAGLVISKVVVLPASAPAAVEGSTSSTTTTTTTTATAPVALGSDPVQLGGTVAELGEDTITLRTEAAATPVKLRYSSTTQWMDGAGHTVTPDFVRPGTQALVYYTNGTSGLVISKIVVRREPAPAAPERTVPLPPPTDPAPEVTAPQKKEVEERPAPKTTSRRKAAVEESPSRKVVEKPVPTLVEKKTTTTTTREERKKKDDDDH
jgi:hypothetical protein